MSSSAHSLLLFAFLSVAGGCAGGGSGVGCPTPNRCTASPIGSWTQIDCEPWDHLSHVDLVNGTAVRSCTLALDHEGIIASGDLAIAAGGRYTRTWVETGAWSGLVAAAGCLDAPGASCATLTAFDGWGATGCAETAEGCRCEGTLDRSGQESGDWQTGSGALVLEADAGGRETSTLCAGDTFMSLDPTGAEIARTYRRQTPTPAQ